MFKYHMIVLLCCSMSLLQAGGAVSCMKAAAEEQIENGNAEKFATLALQTGFKQLEKTDIAEKQLVKFKDATGLEATVNPDTGVINITSENGANFTYATGTNKDVLIKSLVDVLINAGAKPQS